MESKHLYYRLQNPPFIVLIVLFQEFIVVMKPTSRFIKIYHE